MHRTLSILAHTPTLLPEEVHAEDEAEAADAEAGAAVEPPQQRRWVGRLRC